jgi:prepilin-type N-terminal cleavage/methylation domain-containing protein
MKSIKIPGLVAARKRRSCKGVSLVELMIVVAIMGIMAAMVVPKFADQLRRSAEGSTKGSLATLRSALLIYFADNIGVDASTLSAVVPKYMSEIPTAKIGTYHPNSASDANDYWLAHIGTLGPQTDQGGWYYGTPDGTILVNCIHTDTKGQIITLW